MKKGVTLESPRVALAHRRNLKGNSFGGKNQRVAEKLQTLLSAKSFPRKAQGWRRVVKTQETNGPAARDFSGHPKKKKQKKKKDKLIEPERNPGGSRRSNRRGTRRELMMGL